MKFVAYKQANHAQSRVKDSLPDVWITEFITIEDEDKSKFPAEDGWKIVPEPQFDKLFKQCNSKENYKAYQNKLIDEQRQRHEEGLAKIKQ